MQPLQCSTDVKQLVQDIFAKQDITLFGHSISNITLIDPWGNKLQCFDVFHLLKATGERQDLGPNPFYSEYATFQTTETCLDYLIHLAQVAEQHLNEKPTDLKGDRLINAVSSKLDAVVSFHPNKKHLVEKITRLDTQQALTFVKAHFLNAAFKKLVGKNDALEKLSQLHKNSPNCVKLQIARNELTSSTVLETLATDDDMHTRLNVAEHHNTPVHVLETLACDDVVIVRNAVASNINTPFKVLQTLASDPTLIVKNNVAGNPSTPPAVLDMLADHFTAKVSINPSSTIHILNVLSAVDNKKSFLAQNLSLPVDLLEKFVHDSNEHVRRYALANKHTPLSVVRQVDPSHSRLRLLR